MSPFSLLLVLVCLAAAFADEPPPDMHQIELKEHYEHLKFIAEFKCHTPQPRVYPVHQLFPDSQTHGKAYFPDVTVLHRCEGVTGCCPESGHECGPVHIDSVKLPFKVTFLEKLEEHSQGSWIMEYHQFDNHTECKCAPPAPPTKDQLCTQLRGTCGTLTTACHQLKHTCSVLDEL